MMPHKARRTLASTNQDDETTWLVLLGSLGRLKTLHDLFCEAIDKEFESTFAVLADWVHNIQILQNATAGVGVILENDLPTLSPEMSIDCIESHRLLQNHYIDFIRALRWHPLHHDHSVLAYLGESAEQSLSIARKRLTDWILRLRDYVGYAADSAPERFEFLIAQYHARENVAATTRWWNFDSAYSTSLAHAIWRYESGNPCDLCRAARRLMLTHYAWGSTQPERWCSQRQQQVVDAHQKAKAKLDSLGDCSESVNKRLSILQSLTREEFADEAFLCIAN